MPGRSLFERNIRSEYPNNPFNGFRNNNKGLNERKFVTGILKHEKNLERQEGIYYIIERGIKYRLKGDIDFNSFVNNKVEIVGNLVDNNKKVSIDGMSTIKVSGIKLLE